MKGHGHCQARLVIYLSESTSTLPTLQLCLLQAPARMHPKNKYNTRPDFSALASRYPALAPFVHDGRIDFNDAAALRALTTALLEADFGLQVELRDDRLCPTVRGPHCPSPADTRSRIGTPTPNTAANSRLDYALLCLDLVPYTTPRPLRALDIGTGHVAIYALLLHRLRPDAEVVATELDPLSLAHARATVAANCASPAPPSSSAPSPNSPPTTGPLKGRVTVLSAPDDRIFPLLPSGATEYTFMMCNPPFFSSAEEVAASRQLKAGRAPAAPTASANEEITDGGEVDFVSRMIAESVPLAAKVAWFTSLVGRYDSLAALVPRLKKVTGNYYVVSLRQARTTRWVLIWGFGKYRLPDVSCTSSWGVDARV